MIKRITLSCKSRILIVTLFFFSISLIKAYSQNCSVNAGVHQEVCGVTSLFLEGSFTHPVKDGYFVLWEQVGGPAATIVDPTNLDTEVTNLIAGNSYTFRIYTTCEDGAYTFQDVTHTVTEITVADAGDDQVICPAEAAAGTVTLSANAPLGLNEEGYWTGDSEIVHVDDENDPNSTLTLSEDEPGEVTLRWTIENAAGCMTYDEVVITNPGGEPVDAGADKTLSRCYSSTQTTWMRASFAGTGVAGQIGTWSVVSGPNVPTITNIHFNETRISNLIEGVYVFRWTVEGPCYSEYDDVEITVPEPSADVTRVTNVNTSGNKYFCDPTIEETVLTGTASQYVNEVVEWTQVSGHPGVVFSSADSPVTSVTGLAFPNTYVFQYTIRNTVTGCTSWNRDTIWYNPNPAEISIATPDPLVLDCGITVASVDYTSSGAGVTQYRIFSGPAVDGVVYPTEWLPIADIGGLTVPNLTSPGTYQVEMRRQVPDENVCGSEYEYINIVSSGEATISNAGTDQVLDCGVTHTDLVGNVPLLGEGTWSQVSGPTTVILVHPHSPTLTVENLQPDSRYVFRWLLSGGPYCETSQDDVQVITAATVPDPADAGDDQNDVCFGSPVYLNADEPLHVFERGTWSVVPNDGVTFSDIHAHDAVVYGLSAMTTYTFTWRVANGCGSVSDDVTIEVTNLPGPADVDAGADQCLELGATTSTTLSGTDPFPGTGTWTLLSSPVGSNPSFTASQFDTDVTNLEQGVYEFEWAVVTDNCVAVRDTVLITLDSPIPPFNVGADREICGTIETLTSSLGADPAMGRGYWEQISGNAVTIVSPNSYETEVAGMIDGVYVFRYTIENGACSAYDEVRLFVSAEAPSAADVDVSPTDVCGATSVTMAAIEPVSGTGKWTFVSGPNTPTIVSPNSHDTEIKDLITGTYVFDWTVSGGTFCTPNTDQLTLTVTAPAEAGSDQSYCEEVTMVNLEGNPGSTGTWTQVGNTPNVATITETSSNSAVASGLIVGEYTFRYTVAGACGSTDDVTVTLLTPPSNSSAGADQEWCDVSVFNLDATDPVDGDGMWTKLYAPDGETGSFTDPTVHNTTYTGASSGLYVFQWTVSNGDCSNADQVRITNHAEPSDSNAGPDQNLTCDTEVIMAANDPNVGVGQWIFVGQDGDGPVPVIENPILYNTKITNLGPKSSGDPEVYTFRWEITNGPICAAKDDEVEITVYQLPTDANAGSDQDLCNQVSVTLDANTPIVGNGTWTQVSPAVTTEFFVDASDPNTTVNNLIVGETYEFQWTVSTGFCSSTDEVIVTDYELPSTADASATITEMCTLSPIELLGNTPTVGLGTWTQISGDPVVILNPNNPETSVVGGEEGKTYGFRWTISNGPCAVSSDDVTVTINELASQAIAGSDIELCAEGATVSTNMSANAVSVPGETGEWILISNDGETPVIVDPANPNTQITGLTGGSPNVYELQWKHAIGSCESTDNILIYVWEGQTTVDAGPDDEMEGGDDYLLSGAVAQNYTQIFWTTSGTGTFNNSNALNPIYSPSADDITAGSVTLTATAISEGVCNPAIDNMVLHIYEEVDIAASSIVGATCNDNSGSVVLTTSDGSDVTLNGVTKASGSTFSGLAAGYYIATSSSVFPGTIGFNIPNENSTLMGYVVDHQNVSCNGGGNGFIDIDAEGGLAPYTFSLNNTGRSNNTGEFDNLIAAEYGVTISDSNGCTFVVSFDIDEPTLLILSKVSQTNVTCGNTTDGTVTVLASGGTTGYTYTVLNEPVGGTDAVVNNNIISNMEPGDYTIRVTDANGCTADLEVIILDSGCVPGILGTVFEDGDGLSDNTVDGTGTDETIYVNLVNTSNEVLASKLVGAGGTYSFTESDGLAVNTDYILILTSTQQAVGSVLLQASYPANWMSVGENIGSGAGNDGSIDGKLYVSIAGGMINDANFGIYTESSINCPAGPFVFDSAADICGYIIPDNSLDATIPDLVGDITLTHDYGWGNPYTLEGAEFPVGSTDVTWTASFGNGNTSTCTITVVVNDNENPVFLNCPSGTTYSLSLFPGDCDGGAIWSIPVAKDNCSDVTVTQTAGPARGSSLNVGTYTIEYTATDGSGNTATCEFYIKISDTEYPLIACPGNVVAKTDDGNCSWVSPSNSLSPILANSNCPSYIRWEVTEPDGNVETGYNDVSGFEFSKGVSTVKYTIRESTSNRVDICSFTVTVVDEQSPEVDCSSEITENVDPGSCTKNITLDVPSATDNCTSVLDFVYNVYNPDNSFSGPFDALASYDFQYGISRVEWIVTDEDGNFTTCIQNVVIDADSSVFNLTAGEDAEVCEGDSYTLVGAYADNYSTLQWESTGSGSFSNSSELNPVYTPGAFDVLAGEIQLILTVSSDCVSVSDTLNLRVSPLMTAFAGEDVEMCYGESVTIEDASVTSASFVTWTTTGLGELENSNTLSPTYIPAEGETGLVDLIMQVEGVGGCNEELIKDTVSVFYYDPLLVEASGTDTVMINQTALLEVEPYQGSGTYVYYWSPFEMIQFPNSQKTETTPIDSETLFTIIVTDIYTGCQGVDTVRVYVDNSIQGLRVYNGISPNGDGDNDVFWIDGIERYPNNELIIFNRWGDEIKRFSHYDNTSVVWDGTNKRGKNVTDGTYYYILKVEGLDDFAGWVQVRDAN